MQMLHEHGIVVIKADGLALGKGVKICQTQDEVESVMRDLRAASVDMLTIGQYLQPTRQHAPVAEYVAPEVFAHYGRRARALGFREAACAPLVRSSYHAAELMPSS